MGDADRRISSRRRNRSLGRTVAAAILALAALAAAAPAQAEINSVMGGGLRCATVTSEGSVGGGARLTGTVGQRWCGSLPASATTGLSARLPGARSTVKTFDGVPLDVNVAFPPASGPAATRWPVVGMYHSYGKSKRTFDSMQRWLRRGYAVFSLSNRGHAESCQSKASIAADRVGCRRGYSRLMDLRYEVRDAQLLLGRLVDDGVIRPTRIAAVGRSYGGGEALYLAALKNRMMMPGGSLVRWRSPGGTLMKTAVAVPVTPWTDLVQAMAPNGDTLDYLRDGRFNGVGGVMKESWVNVLLSKARNAPSGRNPAAGLRGWKSLLDAGEPYTGAADRAMFKKITRFHSPYYLDRSEAPAPQLVATGFSDDLFPVDEVVRYYNRTRTSRPGAPISIFAASLGHPRARNHVQVWTQFKKLETRWVDHYLKGKGGRPTFRVKAFAQTCAKKDRSERPYTAPDWASLAPGEITVRNASWSTIEPDGGDPAIAGRFRPFQSADTSLSACGRVRGAVEAGTVVFDTRPAPRPGYTLLGAPTVIAKVSVANGPNSQIMARLVDLDRTGRKSLVARGSWRPRASGFQVFQLHPAAWKVEPGHRLRLELLPRDAVRDSPGGLVNYARPSNFQMPVTIRDPELRIPVLERPGSLRGLVRRPAPKVLPARRGAALARGYARVGSQTLARYSKLNGVKPRVSRKATVRGRTVNAWVGCPARVRRCGRSSIAMVARGSVIARGIGPAPARGKVTVARLRLTASGTALFGGRTVVVRQGSSTVVRQIRGVRSARAVLRLNGRPSGTATVRRAGRVTGSFRGGVTG